MYNKINGYLKHKISFENIGIRFFPLAIDIDDIKDFSIKNKNIISFEKVSVEIPFFSLFSKIKGINVNIHHPRVILDETLLKKSKDSVTSDAFKIGSVNIIDGELIFNSPGIYSNLVKFNLKSYQVDQNAVYLFSSPYFRVAFPLSKELVTFGGPVEAEFREELSGWKLNRFYWDTPFLKINFNGRITHDARIALNAYLQGSVRQILDPLLGKLSVHDFMNANAKITKNKDGLIAVDGKINFGTFMFGGEFFRDLKGTVKWDNLEKKLRFNLDFHDDLYKTTTSIEKNGKGVDLIVQNIAVDRITRVIGIDDIIPLDGVIKKAHLNIDGRIFTGDAELIKSPGSSRTGRFPGAGIVEYYYNSKDKYVRFSSPLLQAEFGPVFKLEGTSDPNSETRLTLNFNAAVEDAAGLDKYTSFFVDMPLTQWKLSKGAGIINLDLKRIKNSFVVECDVDMRDFYSGVEKIQSLKGHIASKGKVTRGILSLDDANLQGEMELFLDKRTKKDLRVKFNRLHGESKKIMNILGYDLSLSGPIKGDFTYTNKAGAPTALVEGAFSSPNINFYDFNFENLEGTLKYSSNVYLKNLKFNYNNGKGVGNIFVDFKNRKFDIGGKIKEIDLNRMNPQFKGIGDVSFRGKGEFLVDPILFNYRSGEINFYQERVFSVKGEGKVLTDFSNFSLETGGTIMDKNTPSSFTAHLKKESKQYSGAFHIDVGDINMLIPWGNNRGTITVDGLIIGQRGGSISTEGHASFKGKELSFPTFPHAVKDFSGDMIFKNLEFTLRSFKGTLGNGPVEGSGYLDFKDNHLDAFRIRLSGKNMNLYPMDRTNFVLDADLTLNYIKERDKLQLAGTLELLSGLWEREIDEGISFNTNASLSASSGTIMDMLEYDLKMMSKGVMNFNNSFGEGEANFNLKLSGARDFPVLTGLVESKKGKVNFSGKKFDLLKARLNYNNKFSNTPVIDIESEAYIKNYRIRFTITGLSSKVKPELQSSPPLPPRDILSLIAVGELFRRPTSSELSAQIGTGTTNLIASELTELIAKRTKKIFGNYLLRIEPNISNITGSSVDTSRLIVGKEISKDFLIVYSTDFSTQRQQVIYLQYQVSPALSLIGMRNEDGRISFDLRFRKRH